MSSIHLKHLPVSTAVKLLILHKTNMDNGRFAGGSLLDNCGEIVYIINVDAIIHVGMAELADAHV